MKIKELFEFNPEAELELLRPDYTSEELEIYGWESSDTIDDQRKTTKAVHLKIKNTLENTENYEC